MARALLTKRANIAIKVEATEGTAEALTATEAVIEARNFTPPAYDLPFFPRAAVSASFSRFGGVVGGPRVGTLSFDVDLAGSGTAGTAPGWSACLEACDFLLTDTANSDTYTPRSDCASYTIAAFCDGKQYTLSGARGDVSFDWNAGEVAVMHFKFQGAYVAPTDVALLAPAFEQITPVANCGGAFTYDTKILRFKTLSMAMNNKLVPRTVCDATHLGGVFSVSITDREPKGQMDPEEELAATYDFWTKATTNTKGAFSLVIGATAGNIVTVTMPCLQAVPTGLGDRDGLLIVPLDLHPVRSADAGDDEISIALT